MMESVHSMTIGTRVCHLEACSPCLSLAGPSRKDRRARLQPLEALEREGQENVMAEARQTERPRSTFSQSVAGNLGCACASLIVSFNRSGSRVFNVYTSDISETVAAPHSGNVLNIDVWKSLVRLFVPLAMQTDRNPSRERSTICGSQLVPSRRSCDSDARCFG